MVLILAIIKNHLGCGTIRFRNDGVWVYEVDNKDMLINKIIPFFSKFPFLSDKKKKDFSRFKKLVSIVYTNKSKTYDDIAFICKLLEEIPSKNSRKFTDEMILDRAAKYWALNKVSPRGGFHCFPRGGKPDTSGVLESENFITSYACNLENLTPKVFWKK